MDSIYSAEQIEVPSALPAILKAYTKEVIRYSPADIPAFSRESAVRGYSRAQQPMSAAQQTKGKAVWRVTTDQPRNTAVSGTVAHSTPWRRSCSM